jgi:polar amino acid transport system permease protein
MAVAQATLARDEMAEAEVRREAQASLRFVVWTAVVWVGILVLIGAFLSFIHLDGNFMLQWLPFIAAGIPITLFVSATSILLACVIALIGALGRLSHNPLFFGPATFYVSIIRGTPLILQIFMWYLALPQVKIPGLFPDGIVLEGMLAGIFALAVCYGAYMTETFRGGIQSIGKGQTEAAVALGMTRSQTMRRIILPQALRIVIPPIGNEFIAMTKDSSLVYLMGVWEILFRSTKIGRQYFRNFETLVIAAVFYWIMQIILQSIQSRIETRMARGDR